jgi:hypothetical protein
MKVHSAGHCTVKSPSTERKLRWNRHGFIITCVEQGQTGRPEGTLQTEGDIGSTIAQSLLQRADEVIQ